MNKIIKNYIPMDQKAIKARNEFIQNYERQENLLKQSCYICGESDYDELSKQDRYGFYYPTGLCKTCGCVQQMSYYNDSTLEAFYRDFYRDIYDPENPEERFSHQREVLGNDIYDFTISTMNPKKVLEIGCGAGGILSVFKDKGSKVLGLDYDERFLSEANKKGIDTRTGSIDKLLDGEKFDLIILSHVLEHIVQPKNLLLALRDFMKDDSLIYIEVPSLDSLLGGMYRSDLKRYFQNAHTIHFSTKSLNNLAKVSGYQIIKSDNFIRSLWKRDDKLLQSNLNFEEGYISSLNLIKSINKNRDSFKIKVNILKSFVRSNAGKLLEFLGIKETLKRLLKN